MPELEVVEAEMKKISGSKPRLAFGSPIHQAGRKSTLGDEIELQVLPNEDLKVGTLLVDPIVLTEISKRL